MNQTHDIPILDAYHRDDCPGLKVWCSHCKHWHFHGLGDGHRVAHCHSADSPYARTGYIIREKRA